MTTSGDGMARALDVAGRPCCSQALGGTCCNRRDYGSSSVGSANAMGKTLQALGHNQSGHTWSYADPKVSRLTRNRRLRSSRRMPASIHTVAPGLPQTLEANYGGSEEPQL